MYRFFAISGVPRRLASLRGGSGFPLQVLALAGSGLSASIPNAVGQNFAFATGKSSFVTIASLGYASSPRPGGLRAFRFNP
jgi:hypothetical protein